MAIQLRTRIVPALAIVLFSILTSVGQVNNSQGRHASVQRESSERQGRARPPSRGRAASTMGNLPFEQSVIIYYRTPPKNSPAARSRATDPASTRSAKGNSNTGKASPPDTSPALAAKPTVRRGVEDQLRPILIYYKTHNSSAAVSRLESPDPKIKAKPTGSITANRSIAATPKPAASSSLNSSRAEPRSAHRKADLTGTKSSTSKPGNEVSDRVYEVSDLGAELSRKKAVETTALTAATTIPAASVERQPVFSLSAVAPPAARNIERTADLTSGLARVESHAAGDAANLILDKTSASVPATAESDLDTSASNPLPLESAQGSVDPVALNNSAVQLTSENQFDEARNLLQRAINAQPGVAKFHRNLSIVLEKLKMNEDALASARLAVKLSPTDSSVVEQLCGLELEMGNSSEALRCYEKLGSLEPLDALSQTYLGIALYRSGKVDESIVVLETASKTTPGIALAINALGIAYYETKRLEEAAAAFKNAVEISPEISELRYNLAVARLALRDKAGAISQYKVLKAESPELASRLYSIIYSDKIVFVPKN